MCPAAHRNLYSHARRRKLGRKAFHNSVRRLGMADDVRPRAGDEQEVSSSGLLLSVDPLQGTEGYKMKGDDSSDSSDSSDILGGDSGTSDSDGSDKGGSGDSDGSDSGSDDSDGSDADTSGSGDADT